MSKHRKDPLVEALREGRSYTWTVPDGGNLASMRKAIKHGQTITMSPVASPLEIKVGDFVLVRWHQSIIFHIVGDIQGERFLIINSLGGVNGWVGLEEILGRVTKIVEPEPQPEVPLMLDQLEAAYQSYIKMECPPSEDAQRLLSVVSDLRWYAGRIGPDRWDELPRDNRWSFQQNLWKLTRQARAAGSPGGEHVHDLIDSGKECVGRAAEIIALFQTEGKDQ
ncbi:MAG: hypothetical protein ACM3QS_09100 [Bacteroidota bacterium]